MSVRYVAYLDFLMGRDKDHPLSDELVGNANNLIYRVNELLDLFYIDYPHLSRGSVSSGYRPASINANVNGAAKGSAHRTCQAVDLIDKDGILGNWCKLNLAKLEKVGLYLEHPDYTIGKWTRWVHLSTRAPRSGKRMFIP